MKRFLILSVFTVIIGFASGFFVSQASDDILKKLGLYKNPILILVDGHTLLGKSLKEKLEYETGLQVKVLAANNYDDFKKFSPDTQIWIGRTCWLDRLSKNPDTVDPLTNEDWVRKNISPDFLTFEHHEIRTVPLLWTFGKSPHGEEGQTSSIPAQESYPIILIGIKLSPDLTPQNEVLEVLKTLRSKSWIQIWIETLPLATTYMTLDESLIEKYQKASFFRELDFRKIQKVNSESTLCDDFKFSK